MRNMGGLQRAEARAKNKGGASEVSSFHTAPRASISTGFRASKRRIFEITQNNHPEEQWDRQWAVAPSGSRGAAPRGEKDPFEINYLN